MIDDFTNIHTKRGPSDQTTSTARNMATILLKQFDDGSAIPVHKDTINPGGLCEDKLLQVSQNICSCFSTTCAMSMPYWIRATFFDPEMERSRIEIHNYQEHLTGTQCMRKMTGCKLLDELESPRKSFENFKKAACHAVEKGLSPYLSKFICPLPGDWRAQVFMRQIQHHAKESSDGASLQNGVPFLGPLHIQLNARECLSSYY